MLPERMWFAVYGFWLLLALAVLAAHYWGGSSERRVAVLYLAAALATLVLRLPGTSRYAALNVGVFLIDLLLLVGLLWIVARDARWWLIASAALQLVTVLGHVAMLDAPATHPLAYFMTVVASSYPALLLLLFATISSKNRMQGSGG